MNTTLSKQPDNQPKNCRLKDSHFTGNKLNPNVALLGYAGLLPFIGLTVAAFVGYDLAKPWFCIYSAIIVAFLAGNQWQPENTETAYLYHSNALAIVAAIAIAVHPLSSLASIVLLIAAYLWLLAIEYKQGSTGHYRAMRIRLSSIVVSLHLIMLVI